MTVGFKFFLQRATEAEGLKLTSLAGGSMAEFENRAISLGRLGSRVGPTGVHPAARVLELA